MKAVIQKVTHISVKIGEEVASVIGKGLFVLVGITQDDTIADSEFIIGKILNLKLFDDPKTGKKLDKSLKDLGLDVLVVNQFTLYGLLEDNNVDYHLAMEPTKAKEFYKKFYQDLKKAHAQKKNGDYGVPLQVGIDDDGPVTITIESKDFVCDNFDNESELPLWEELGISFGHIGQKSFAVLKPVGTTPAEAIADQDLVGPVVFCLLFGVSLLLNGKLHFGYIYGYGLLGCFGMYYLLNLMAEEQRSISFIYTASVLGYCLLPLSILSMLAAVLSLNGIVGYCVTAAAVFWCASTSSKLFSITLQMEGQRLLVAYPCLLLYCIFALLAIF